MKILLVNKFYYPRGGDCVYTIELEKILKENNNQVAIFTQHHDENYSSKYSKYWVSNLDYSTMSPKNFTSKAVRPFYSIEVIRKFSHLLDDFQPDVVHLNNIHSYISPIVAKLAFARGIRTVWTIHDYKFVCPAYHCLRKGSICEKCFTNPFNVFKNRCIKDSYLASSAGYLEKLIWNTKKLNKYTDTFICPTEFISKKMIEGGIDQNKIIVLHNLINDNRIRKSVHNKSDYYCYLGRLSQEKGVHTLLRAARIRKEFILKILGDGPLFEDLKCEYVDEHIEFLGKVDWNEIERIVSKARFTVMPSECYENGPVSLIESLSLGTPVIGSNIGGIKELIVENETGLLFETTNHYDLAAKIKKLFNNSVYEGLAVRANDYAKKNFGGYRYYENLLQVYQNNLPYKH